MIEVWNFVDPCSTSSTSLPYCLSVQARGNEKSTGRGPQGVTVASSELNFNLQLVKKLVALANVKTDLRFAGGDDRTTMLRGSSRRRSSQVQLEIIEARGCIKLRVR